MDTCERILVLEEPDAFIVVMLRERARVWGRQTGHVPLQGEILPEVAEGTILKALKEARLRRGLKDSRRRAQLLEKAIRGGKTSKK